jgi:hypothetical protein
MIIIVLMITTTTTESDMISILNHQQSWWVIKGSMSDGAGGIWMVNSNNSRQVQEQLIVGHSYIAQL